jgi:hypothetical protein
MITSPPSPLTQLRQGQLTGTQRLDLSGCGLSELPSEVFALADSLEVLDLTNNALSHLPHTLPRLKKLRIIFASGNRFTELPPVLGQCEALEMVGFKVNRIGHVSASALPTRLRWLILTDNAIDVLPPELGRCQRLQKLALAGNRLQALPESMQDCRQLELARVSANRLGALPDWLLTLPRLSWLAFGGNPFSSPREQEALTHTPLPQVDWATLQLQAQLGEGASGVIHRARQEPEGRSVALKVFKGEVTSDGLPSSEMAAALHAGAHPNLIPVLARLSGHPAQAQGLLMQLIAPEFQSLAQPPSLASCTRDVYAPGTRFDLPTLRQMAGGIASALAQLHQRGITHGDLYGHNILHDGRGQAFLGDFGAASFVPADTPHAQALALQRLDVRAFGCLLEELIERCSDDVGAALQALPDACLDEMPTHRPLFGDITHALR